MARRRNKRSVAIYHEMRADDDFLNAAQALYQTVQLACTKYPGRPRILFLDIQGHRNDEGGYDQDAYELQSRYLAKTLMPFLTQAHTPLLTAEKQYLTNPKPQRDDIDDKLTIRKAPQRRENKS
jgi:hypothetical protein